MALQFFQINLFHVYMCWSENTEVPAYLLFDHKQVFQNLCLTWKTVKSMMCTNRLKSAIVAGYAGQIWELFRNLHSFLVHWISLSSVHELQSNERISYSSKVPCSPPTTHHPLLWATQLLLFPSLVVEGRKKMSYLFINLKSSYTC